MYSNIAEHLALLVCVITINMYFVFSIQWNVIVLQIPTKNEIVMMTILRSKGLWHQKEMRDRDDSCHFANRNVIV